MKAKNNHRTKRTEKTTADGPAILISEIHVVLSAKQRRKALEKSITDVSYGCSHTKILNTTATFALSANRHIRALKSNVLAFQQSINFKAIQAHHPIRKTV